MKTSKILILFSAVGILGSNTLFADTDTTSVMEKKDNSVHIVMPEIPKVPKVPKVYIVEDGKLRLNSQEVKEEMQSEEKKNEPAFGKRVPKSIYTYKAAESKKEVLAGEINNDRVAAYLHLPLLDQKDVLARLQKAGFKVLAQYKLDKKATAVSIVFTDATLEKAAQKKTRGFISNLRIVIDRKDNIVNIPNPIYVLGAFMQDEYDSKLAHALLKRLRDAFSGAKNSEEVVKFSILPRYRFMENMPYYQDMAVLAKGKNSDLLEKAKKSRKIIFQQKLANGNIILGIKLGRRTSKFVKKIGFTDGGVLPYPILIENGEAKILDPKYYIAMMYPMLKMSQFMKIATIPGAIQNECGKIFR